LAQPSFTKPPGPPFIELQSVDSTNNYALEQVHAGLAQHGMAIFAHEQWAGKGQRGKVWLGEKDANIFLSLVIQPRSLQTRQQYCLSACMAVAVQDFFMKYAGKETKIKWPNDLYWQDRKAGGMLIESIVSSGEPGVENEQRAISNWKWSVIGIGININQTTFPVELQNPVSLKQITGKDFDVIELARELCEIMNHHFEQLTIHGFENIYNTYLSHLYKKNETVKLSVRTPSEKMGNRIFEATIKTVSPA
jgi:BirA family biotin operon repressor/biotin-[acetyl-CoA-carboxylase] ligase